MPEPYDTVAERSGGMCERACGRPAQQMHHRCSRQAGGSKNTPWMQKPSNIVHLCGTSADGCHGWATSRPLEAQPTGWVVLRGLAQQYGGAGFQPLTDLQGRSFLLTDAGTKIPVVVLDSETGTVPASHPEGS